MSLKDFLRDKLLFMTPNVRSKNKTKTEGTCVSFYVQTQWVLCTITQKSQPTQWTSANVHGNELCRFEDQEIPNLNFDVTCISKYPFNVSNMKLSVYTCTQDIHITLPNQRVNII